MGPQATDTITIGADGEVTLGDDLLKHLGVHPGERVGVTKLADGRIEIRRVRPTGRISDVFGRLKRRNGPSLSVEKMNRIAARGWAGMR